MLEPWEPLWRTDTRIDKHSPRKRGKAPQPGSLPLPSRFGASIHYMYFAFFHPLGQSNPVPEHVDRGGLGMYNLDGSFSICLGSRYNGTRPSYAHARHESGISVACSCSYSVLPPQAQTCAAHLFLAA